MSFSPKNANIPINRKYYDPLYDQERVNKFYTDIIFSSRAGIESALGNKITTNEEIYQRKHDIKNSKIEVQKYNQLILKLEQNKIDLKRELQFYEIGSFVIIGIVLFYSIRKFIISE